MSVTAVSNFNFQAPEPPVSRRHAEDVAGRQLMQALESGDLAGAQQAYNTLAGFGPNNSGPFSSPTLSAEFKALGQAITAGDTASALQDARTIGKQQLAIDVNAVKQDLQGGNGGDVQQAIANLRGDLWAVYGLSTEGTDQATSAAPTSGINTQA